MDILNDGGYEKMTFENYDFTDFWDDIDYSLNEYVEEYPSDEMIESVEKELGYKLPESYIWLMKQHNGGITTKSCFPTNEPTTWAENHVAITGILGIGLEKRYSLCGEFGSQFMIDEWEYPAIGVAICDCPSAGHDMIFLDYRECGPKGEPKVVHVDQEHDYKITHLADTFEEFICGLKDEEFFEDDFDDLEDDNVEILELAKAMMNYLDCECRYFPPMEDDYKIMSAYNSALEESQSKNYVPMLIKVDETLWECLIMNSDSDSEGANDYEFNYNKVDEYRKEMLATTIEDGKKLLDKFLNQRREELEDDEIAFEEIFGNIENGYENNRFVSYWDFRSKMTSPLILAKIPVKNPWEVFAYLPFGNWNDCPDTPELMAVLKYWYENYGAIPAAITHDELEIKLQDHIKENESIEVALDQYGFCPDIVDQGLEDATIGSLADVLRQSDVWYFWWD